MHRRVTGLAALALAGTVLLAGAPAFAAEPAATSVGEYAGFEMSFPVGSTLSQAEMDGLLWMREEEKLAHDVYLALYDEWGLATFSNIARAEQRHLEAVSRLLGRYGIEDPADDLALGEFSVGALQDLYDRLIAQGSQSLAEALKVGAAIEEIDIVDLKEEITQAEASDVQRLYGNLLRGSEKHLQAFVSTLAQQTGETYVPQYLDADDYAGIVAPAATSSAGRGRGGR